MSRAIDRFVRMRRVFALTFVVTGLCLPFALCLVTGYAWSSATGVVVFSFLPAVAIVLLILEPYTNLGLRRQLRDSRGALCPGCAYPLGDLDDETCPECGERWTADTARYAWGRALGAGWTNVLNSPSDERH